jgi:hypothetical protein
MTARPSEGRRGGAAVFKSPFGHGWLKHGAYVASTYLLHTCILITIGCLWQSSTPMADRNRSNSKASSFHHILPSSSMMKASLWCYSGHCFAESNFSTNVTQYNHVWRACSGRHEGIYGNQIKLLQASKSKSNLAPALNHTFVNIIYNTYPLNNVYVLWGHTGSNGTYRSER